MAIEKSCLILSKIIALDEQILDPFINVIYDMQKMIEILKYECSVSLQNIAKWEMAKHVYTEQLEFTKI